MELVLPIFFSDIQLTVALVKSSEQTVLNFTPSTTPLTVLSLLYKHDSTASVITDGISLFT